jgi:hypothetical protein
MTEQPGASARAGGEVVGVPAKPELRHFPGHQTREHAHEMPPVHGEEAPEDEKGGEHQTPTGDPAPRQRGVGAVHALAFGRRIQPHAPKDR